MRVRFFQCLCHKAENESRKTDLRQAARQIQSAKSERLATFLVWMTRKTAQLTPAGQSPLTTSRRMNDNSHISHQPESSRARVDRLKLAGQNAFGSVWKPFFRGFAWWKHGAKAAQSAQTSETLSGFGGSHLVSLEQYPVAAISSPNGLCPAGVRLP